MVHERQYHRQRGVLQRANRMVTDQRRRFRREWQRGSSMAQRRDRDARDLVHEWRGDCWDGVLWCSHELDGGCAVTNSSGVMSGHIPAGTQPSGTVVRKVADGTKAAS